MRRTFALVLAGLWLAAAAEAETIGPDAIADAAGAVDQDAIIANAEDSRNWPSYGLSYAETRYSTLDQIDSDNVQRLGLAWSATIGSKRGFEATPLVVDGVMYVTGPWSIVYAFDAQTGEELWRYDPEVPADYAAKGCCDVVNRGVALYEGKVYLGAFDGYLHAIDAVTGAPLWSVDTIENRALSYTITGAPRVYNGKVIIGNAGDAFGVRGYVSAYDAETGALVWRWYSVPGDPAQPVAQPSLVAAAETWDPAGRWWELGGGGAVWDAMAFDPELNILYIGTGTGSPWDRHHRSPAGGDNLYISSIVALDPDSGRYLWHYQTTPGDSWGYGAAEQIVLADLEIDGAPRKVLLQASKNGFFFVIDRLDGSFISARPFVEINWAGGYDRSGRPIEVPEARSETAAWEAIPSALGAHGWQPMSFNRETGLVYIPVQGIPLTQQSDPDWRANAHVPGSIMSNLGWNLGYRLNSVPPQAAPFGQLLAWDPVAGREVWHVDYGSPWNGGTLTTAGNLVFQGTADGRFLAYDATTGEALWEVPVGSGVVAAPMTYELDGQQYVAIAVGWGGLYGQLQRATERRNPGRIYVFALDGDAGLPPVVELLPSRLLQGVPYDPEEVEPGRALYVSNCIACHGVPGANNGGNVPNLGYSDPDTIASLAEVVLSPALESEGMPDFTGLLTPEQVTEIAAYVQAMADFLRDSKRQQ